jgi:putative intracellular protease/amidase
MSARIWMPLPDRDFEPSEAAFPWRALKRAGHDVVFATEKGSAAAQADPRMLGSGAVFGKMGASREGKEAYAEMAESPAFRAPIAWSAVEPSAYDGLLLPGGHARGMKQYLDSEALREKVSTFWKLDRPVGAICHGVLVLSRAKDKETGESLLARRRTTCLVKYMEAAAYYATFWKLGLYYRTYDVYTEDEVRAVLANPRAQFERGPFVLTDPSTGKGERKAFVVEDRNYVSGRWPGDARLLGERFVGLVEDHLRKSKGTAQASASP